MRIKCAPHHTKIKYIPWNPNQSAIKWKHAFQMPIKFHLYIKCASNVHLTTPKSNALLKKSKSKCNQMEACISNAHQMWLVHQMRIKCTSHHTKIKCTSRNLNQSTIKCPSNTNQLQIKCMLKIKYESSNQMPIKWPVAFDLPLMGIWLTFDWPLTGIWFA